MIINQLKMTSANSGFRFNFPSPRRHDDDDDEGSITAVTTVCSDDGQRGPGDQGTCMKYEPIPLKRRKITEPTSDQGLEDKNTSQEEPSLPPPQCSQASTTTTTTTTDCLIINSAKCLDVQHLLRDVKQTYCDEEVTDLIISEDMTIKHLKTTSLEEDGTNKDDKKILDHFGRNILLAVEKCSDLIPQIYEGGLKIWECSIDLLTFLHREQINFNDKIVMEIGCGAGLPGIYALMSGAKKVIFQDFNEEVLNEVTLKNILMNYTAAENDKRHEALVKKVTFYTGDWMALVEKIECQNISLERCDIILTCETIYNTESYTKLHSIFKTFLKHNGIILLAAKTYYFGVGGGTRLFESFLLSEGGDLESSIAHVDCEGLKREILKIHWKVEGLSLKKN